MIIQNRVGFLPAAALATAFAAQSAHAGFMAVDPFLGQYSESFEGRSFAVKSGSIPVFSEFGTMHEKSNSSLIMTGSWSFNVLVKPQDGTRLMGSPASWMQYDFLSPILQFGGYFTTNSGVADGRLEFYSNGVLVDSEALKAPSSGSWAWNGWKSDAGFNSVRVIGNYSSGGFVMQDNLQVNVTPAPGATALMAAAGALVIVRRRPSTR